jgi:hypothetical protein
MGGCRRYALLALLATCACLQVGAAPGTSVAWRSMVAPALLAAYDGGALVAQTVPMAALHSDGAGRIQIDVTYDCSSAPSAQMLTAAGFMPDVSIRLPPLCTSEGWAAASALPAIAALPGVQRVDAPRYALPRSPPTPVATSGTRESIHSQVAYNGIDGNGASIMRADQFVAQTTVDGAGVTVGVQSGGVASLAVIQGRGELPAVQVVGINGASLPGDEGTALLEEIHAVAPEAGLAFCDSTTYVEYLSCLDDLIRAGASILVDDLDFPPDDLMSSNSSDAQAIEQLLAQNPNVLLLTSAGNSNGSYWEGSYAPVTTAAAALAPLSCNGQTDTLVEAFGGTAEQRLTVSASSYVPIALAWADPAGSNSSNFDLYWSSDADSSQSGCFSASSVSGPILVETLPLLAGTYTLRIGTPDASLSGKLLKLWIGGDGLTSISAPTPGSVTAPQAFAAGVVRVGAVNGSDGIGSGIESFSSLGPLTVVFPTVQHIQVPTLVAPDGVRVDAAGTQFQGYLFPDGNFYGTSASAPNAAAVAALLRSAFPRLTPAQLLSSLENGATVLGASRPDFTFGYGRVDALGALGTLAAPTITALPDAAANAGASSAPMAFTVTGTGELHFSVTSSDPAVIPAALVAAGTPGVTVSPAGCGTSTLTCSVVVTPAYGGTSTVTLSAVDGAHRAAAATIHLTASGSPPPAATPAPAPSPTSSGGGGGGGGLGWLEIAALLGLAGYRLHKAVCQGVRRGITRRHSAG